MHLAGLETLDIVALCLLLLVSVSIGVYYGIRGRQKTNKDFLLGGKSISFIPMSFSLMASYLSSITLLGFPAEIYANGIEIYALFIGMFAGIITSTFLFIPVLYPLNFISVYEYLEVRFRSKLVRYLASITFITQMVFYMAIVTYAPVISLEKVTNLPSWAIIIITGTVCVLYTFLGGMKAVVWTDVYQICMILVGMSAVLIVGYKDHFSISEVLRIAQENGRLNYFNLNLNPYQRHSLLLLFFGHLGQWMGTYGCTQTQVQRYCSMRSVTDSWKVLLLVIPGISILMVIIILTGLLIFAFYFGCDPISHEGLKKDFILPLFVLTEMATIPGIRGLFIASLFSGSLSTLSSGINSLAAVAWEDFCKGSAYFNDFNEERKAVATKILSIVFGVAVIALACFAEYVGSLIQAVGTLVGLISAPLTAVFLMALLFPFTNKYGAVTCIVVGHLASLWMGIGGIMFRDPPSMLPMSVERCSVPSNISVVLSPPVVTSLAQPSDPLQSIYQLSYLLHPIVGTMFALVLGCAVSLLTGGLQLKSSDRKLVVPLAWRIFQFFGMSPEDKESDSVDEKSDESSETPPFHRSTDVICSKL